MVLTHSTENQTLYIHMYIVLVCVHVILTHTHIQFRMANTLYTVYTQYNKLHKHMYKYMYIHGVK